jgi:4-diphosphocytidyl-2-methyl-D-erithritol synthase
MNLLIPAAGIGRRMGSSRNKLLLTLLGKSLLSWTLEAAVKSRHISWIGIIGQPIDFPDFQKNISDFSTDKHIELIEGGGYSSGVGLQRFTSFTIGIPKSINSRWSEVFSDS